jgi:hypothetical protein
MITKSDLMTLAGRLFNCGHLYPFEQSAREQAFMEAVDVLFAERCSKPSTADERVLFEQFIKSDPQRAKIVLPGDDLPMMFPHTWSAWKAGRNSVDDSSERMAGAAVLDGLA